MLTDGHNRREEMTIMSLCYNCLVKTYNGYRLGTGGAGAMISGTLRLTKTSTVKMTAGNVGSAVYNATANAGGETLLFVDDVLVASAGGGKGGSSSGPTAGAGGTGAVQQPSFFVGTPSLYDGNKGNTASYNHSGTGYAAGATLGGTNIPSMVPRTSVTGNWSMTFVPGCSPCSTANHGTRSAPPHTPNGIGGMVLLIKK